MKTTEVSRQVNVKKTINKIDMNGQGVPTTDQKTVNTCRVVVEAVDFHTKDRQVFFTATRWSLYDMYFY